MKKPSGESSLIIAIIIFAILSIFRGELVDSSEAVRALQTQGYSEIEITDKAVAFVGLRGGDRGDAAMFTAHAKNPIGRDVTVYVCVGWPFKGATVRTK